MNKIKTIIITLAIAACIIPTSSFAKTLKTKYFSLEYPAEWSVRYDKDTLQSTFITLKKLPEGEKNPATAVDISIMPYRGDGVLGTPPPGQKKPPRFKLDQDLLEGLVTFELGAVDKITERKPIQKFGSLTGKGEEIFGKSQQGPTTMKLVSFVGLLKNDPAWMAAKMPQDLPEEYLQISGYVTLTYQDKPLLSDKETQQLEDILKSIKLN